MTTFLGAVQANNFAAGRQGHVMTFGGADDPSFVVIHTLGGTIAGATTRFKDPASQTSAHYGVGLDGSVVQWVLESDTAYHAANRQMNVRSFGIEHEDNVDPNGERTDALYAASSALVRDLCQRYMIPISRQWIIQHSEVPDVTTKCPGSLDIDRIVAMAAGTWRAESASSPAAAPTPRPATPVMVASTTASPAGGNGRPPIASPPTPTSTEPVKAAPKQGDALRDIATTIYGDPNRAPDIYKSIQGVVNEVPSLVQLGKMLTAVGWSSPESVSGEPVSPAPAGPARLSTQAEDTWGGTPAAIFSVQIVYLTILAVLAIIFFTNRDLIDLPQTLGPLPIAIPWFGALGAVLISLVGVTEHRQDWDPSYRFWHWSRPLLGASFGSISVIIFQAGILAVGTQPTPDGSNVTKDLLYYLTAFVVGYREETFRELIKRLSDVIFTPGPSTSPLSVSSMTPLQGPAAGGTAVTIVGNGLSATDTIRFGTVAATSFHVDGDGQVTAVSPPGAAGTTVNVVVSGKASPAVAGSFTYV
jgi:hypothetical protein